MESQRSARDGQERFHADLGGAFTPLYGRLRELGVAGRITEIGKIGPRGRSADFAVDDQEQFLRDLEASGRFCTDTTVGRIFHPRHISLREDQKAQSLHIAIGEDGRVIAHLDRFSPVSRARLGQVCRYSLLRVVVHNLARLLGDTMRLLLGRKLDCAPLILSLQHAPPEKPAGADDECEQVVTAAPQAPPVRTTPPARQGTGPTGPAAGATEAPRRLLFNTIDEAIHVLDNPVEPWSVHVEARVTGTLDEERLRSAIAVAAAAHPLARVRKVAGPLSARHYEWEVTPEAELDPLQVVDCPRDEDLIAARASLVSLAVPLAESPPFRARLAHHPAGDALMLNVNGAASDPVGGMRLLRSIARAYAGHPDPLPSLDRTAARDVGHLLRARDLPTKEARIAVLLEKTRDLISVPVRVAVDGGVDRPSYGVHLVTGSTETTERLLALDGIATPGEVLLAALHLAIALWNIEHGVHCGRISVLMPVNFRPGDWHEEVMGNFSLLTRVSTTPHQRSLGKVLAAVQAQLRHMCDRDSMAALIEFLARASDLPI